nr:MAG TPA: hypothetical protein [Caudoviricetes sp.]
MVGFILTFIFFFYNPKSNIIKESDMNGNVL